MHLEVDPAGDLTVSGFDYESSGQHRIAVERPEPGRVLVPGRLLADAVKALPSLPVQVSHEDGASRTEVACGSTRFELPTLPIEDYPILPDMPPIIGTVDAGDLAEAIAQASTLRPSKQSISGMPALAAISVLLGPDQLTVMACDRYRFATRVIPWEAETTDLDTQLLIPGAFLTAFRRVLPKDGRIGLAAEIIDGMVTRVGLQSETVRGVARVLGGDYPNVLRALELFKPVATAMVDAKDFREAVARMSLILNEGQPFWMRFSGDDMTLTASNESNGSVADALPVKMDHDLDKEPEVLVNPVYLTEGLKALEPGSDVVHLQFMGYMKPLLLTSLPPNDPSLTFRYMMQSQRKT
jgi:DNA polymerase III subunit beta